MDIGYGSVRAELMGNIFLSEKKKLIQDIIDKVTFYDKGVVRVEGHIPQFAQNMAYGTERRNSRVTKCREEYAL